MQSLTVQCPVHQLQLQLAHQIVSFFQDCLHRRFSYRLAHLQISDFKIRRRTISRVLRAAQPPPAPHLQRRSGPGSDGLSSLVGQRLEGLGVRTPVPAGTVVPVVGRANGLPQWALGRHVRTLLAVTGRAVHNSTFTDCG